MSHLGSNSRTESGSDAHSVDIHSASEQEAWAQCCQLLRDEMPEQQYNTWIRPLKLLASPVAGEFRLAAPNRFIRDWVVDKFQPRIQQLLQQLQHLQSGNQLVIDISDSPAPGFAKSRPGVYASEQANHAVEGKQAVWDSRANPDATIPPEANRNYQRHESGPVPRPQSFGHLSGHDAGLGSNAIGQEGLISASANAAGNGRDLREREVEARGRPDYHAGSGALDFLDNPMQDESNSHQHLLNRRIAESSTAGHQHNLIEAYRFENFVEGKSNQLARAAATQVVENPGGSYNPLFLYGGVGLGKTHLMHAVGNALKQRKPNARVVYLHSERFVADMVKALQLNAINDFKRFYRSVDALLIDDIQFFANKERSQEEFFHTFNALLEGNKQMILTCDRYPKEINGVEERLKSRFGWGLTVAIEPPELETRVAILMKKAEQAQMPMAHDTAFFLAQRVRSNVRELEGALKRVIASAHFTNQPITVELVKESLKDLLALQDKQISIDNIQRTTAEYYKIKVADLMSKRRNRSVARPRQVAMALAKELTNHSLPEIGDAFGGRDHTTVLHACRKIKELRDTSSDIQEDYQNLLRTLAT